jgi:hypothetical protein
MSTTGKRVGAIREHLCGHCDKVELWGKGWRWVVRDGKLDETVCSEACELKLSPPGPRKAAAT